jgi:hypothetical protein
MCLAVVDQFRHLICEAVMTQYQESAPEKRWDALGGTLSLLCVIHCIAMPFLIGYLPFLGLDWLAGGVSIAALRRQRSSWGA